MNDRQWWLGCLALAFVAAGTGCDGSGGGGSGGEGGQGGSTSNLKTPVLLGDPQELTTPSVDLVGDPVMGARATEFAIGWVGRSNGYLDGQGVLIPFESGTDGTGFVAGIGAAAIQPSEDGSFFGMVMVTEGGPFEGNGFTFRTFGTGVQSNGYKLTDYLYTPASVDVVMSQGEWHMIACLQDIKKTLHIAKNLTSAPQNSLDPLPLTPLAMAEDVQCDQVKLARKGDEVWAVYSGRVTSEAGDAIFLQRFLPTASEAVRVTEPGAKPKGPHLFVHNSELVVVFWHGADKRYAAAEFDGEGKAKGPVVALESGEDTFDSFDAALLGDRIVIGSFKQGGVRVQSFDLSGQPATASLTVAPQPAYDADRPALAVIDEVVGVAHYGEGLNDDYTHVYFARVGDL